MPALKLQFQASSRIQKKMQFRLDPKAPQCVPSHLSARERHACPAAEMFLGEIPGANQRDLDRCFGSWLDRRLLDCFLANPGPLIMTGLEIR